VSESPSPEPLADVVTALRSAGCVFAEHEARLLLAEGHTPDELAEMVARRASGVPLEHVLGWAGFCGRRISVAAGVFVPRHRSALLVREAIASAPPSPVVVDLCCGSGALGLAVFAGVENATLHAADIEPAAVRCARRNLAAVGGHVYEGDLYDALPASLRGHIDVVTANTPYVPTADLALLPPEARLHEPQVALDGGPDGLDLQRRVAAHATGWLAPGGHLLVETSRRQAPLAAAIFTSEGLSSRVATSDELDATVVIGTRPRAQP